jgi:RNA-directed DNA polymerase
MRGTGADQPVVVKKSRNGDGAKGLDRSALRIGQLRRLEEEPTSKAKPFGISKRVVWEAYQWVKANNGAAGVDGESIEEFEKNLKNNLYKLWNRMSSGSYFAPPVRVVEIPKTDGGKRALGIPTVGDRVAQVVTKMYLEPRVEPYFHGDSYGYRPGKSAVQAVGVARKRCWQYDWVLDVDIKGFLEISSYCAPFHERLSKRVAWIPNTLIYKPFRFPQRTWTAERSPRFTRCNTVCRETPRSRMASTIGT